MVMAPMDAFEEPRAGEEADGQPAEDAGTAPLRRDRLAPFAAARRAGRGSAAETPVSTPGGRVADAIEAALLPRLVLLHGGRGKTDAGIDAALAALIDPFAACLIADDEAASATALLRDLRGKGTSFETICLDVMAPAARRLGAMWTTDDCDFTLVTLGLSRLHRLMRELDAQLAAIALPVDPGRVALLAVAPGEQHVFGLVMVGDFLRRAGWEIHDLIGASTAEIAATARSTRATIAALSCSMEAQLPALAGRISGIRGQSRNRDIAILVGGLAFSDAPEAAIRVGADAMARDARDAVFQAERLLAVNRAEMAVR
jgi:methanogenic corrinoid protein MtbC1